MTLADLIQQTHFPTPAHEAVLNVVATDAWISGEMSGALSGFDVTRAQYNVLRILRGGHPTPYACSEIASRLLDRMPDVTRLLARLEANGLVRRSRAEHDRRVVEVEITDEGLAVLGRLDEPMEATIAHLTAHLTDEELVTLSRLLDKLRTDQR